MLRITWHVAITVFQFFSLIATMCVASRVRKQIRSFAAWLLQYSLASLFSAPLSSADHQQCSRLMLCLFHIMSIFTFIFLLLSHIFSWFLLIEILFLCFVWWKNVVTLQSGSQWHCFFMFVGQLRGFGHSLRLAHTHTLTQHNPNWQHPILELCQLATSTE